MLNVITNFFIYRFPFLSSTHLVTSLGVRMRKPFDKNGMWIGWTAEETAEHLASINNYQRRMK
jgi:hypothetical protein